MPEEDDKPKTRVENGRVYLSNVSQEERKQAPTRRENIGSRYRSVRNRERFAREAELSRREEVKDEEAARALAGAERLAERRRMLEERQGAKMAYEAERRKIPPSRLRRLAGGIGRTASGRFKKRKGGPRRAPSKKLPYHHGQHKSRTDKQCKAYRKHQRVLKAQRRLARELNS